MLKLIFPLIITTMNPMWSNNLLTMSLAIIIMLSMNSHMDITMSTSPYMMLDNMSVMMITLTLWVSMLMFSASSKKIIMNNQNNKFFFLCSALTTILMVSFCVNNLMLFYITFEASLIPTLLLILIWGYQPERIQAGVYLMMYTMAASLPLLLSLTFIYSSNKNLNMLLNNMENSTNECLVLMVLMAFLVKMPMYSFHLWLPKAHVEAPVAGSMILAGILLKLGVYGMMRTMYFWPNVSISCDIAIAISAWGAIMTSMICMRQQDLKSLIAYSSVSHMALVIMGLMTMTMWGWQGSLTMMIAHGLTSSGLFAMANANYEEFNSRSLFLSKGILESSPLMSLFWFLLLSTNMAVPPSLNLMAEITLLTSAMFYSSTLMIMILMMMMFTTVYTLGLYASMNHGTQSLNANFLSTPNINSMTNSMHLIPVLCMFTVMPFITEI
uniref:NADH-ubiquinone oxidoreductase chain 4 n=1 Tax=Trypanobia cryptica TaxID=2814713 RepID=A0A0K0YD71_9ANNE|nr:NADH dehydrogenase subunit 4 [Trypanobia cryptica]